MTSKAEGYLRIPVWSDDGVIKPVVDDNGRIPIQLAGIDVTLDVNLESSDITLNVSEQSPLANIEARGYGYDGATWRKLPLVWGFSGEVEEASRTQKVGAGQYTYSSTPVPAGEVHVLEVMGLYNETTGPGTCTISVVKTIGQVYVAQGTPTGIWISLKWNGRLTLVEGDRIDFIMNTCLNNDWIVSQLCGYKMAVV